MSKENGDVQVSVTPTLVVTTMTTQSNKKLEVTGPFNVYEINPSKGSDSRKVNHTPFIVPPITIHPKTTKKETADTALTATEATLKESKAAYIRSIISYIDAVLGETTGVDSNSRLGSQENLSSTRMLEEEIPNIVPQIGSLPKRRQLGHNLIFTTLASSLRNEIKAKTLAFSIEDLIFKLNGKMESDYVETVQVLAAELAKPSTSEVDIIRLSRSKLSDLEIFVSTLKKPAYFEL